MQESTVSRTHDMHRLALLIRSCASSFFYYKKSVLFHTMLPSEGSRLDDPNMNTHLHMSAHHEEPSKTGKRSWKEQQGKCLRQFFKRKMWFGKKVILPSDFKTISFEKIILWEIAARKLDSSPVGIESPCC